jgi:hypothetical protein
MRYNEIITEDKDEELLSTGFSLKSKKVKPHSTFHQLLKIFVRDGKIIGSEAFDELNKHAFSGRGIARVFNEYKLAEH